MKKFSRSLVACLPAIVLTTAGFLFLFPLLASADVSLFPTGYWGPLVSCAGINCNTCHIFSTAQMVIYFMMTLTIFVIGPIMITAGGIMMLISAGNAERFSSGRKMATGAVIGILIGLGAFLIVNTLLRAIAKQVPGFNSDSGFTIQCNARSPFVPAIPRQDSEIEEIPSLMGPSAPAAPAYTDPSVPPASEGDYSGPQYEGTETPQDEP